MRSFNFNMNFVVNFVRVNEDLYHGLVNGKKIGNIYFKNRLKKDYEGQQEYEDDGTTMKRERRLAFRDTRNPFRNFINDTHYGKFKNVDEALANNQIVALLVPILMRNAFRNYINLDKRPRVVALAA